MPPSVEISEPALPLWAAPAASLALGAWLSVLPGSPCVARATAAAAAGDARGALLWSSLGDAALAVSVFAFFKLSEVYGRARHPRGGIRPYSGPWRNDENNSSKSSKSKSTRRSSPSPRSRSSSPVVPPRWFAPPYLLFALTAACLAPAAGLAHALLTSGGVSDPASAGASAAVALFPYLSLWCFQWLCEMKFFRRSFVAPAVPLAFSLARPWQLARSAALAEYLAEAAAASKATSWSVPASAAAPVPMPSPRWLPAALRLLSLFWTFDTAALLVWLPWTYNYHQL